MSLYAHLSDCQRMEKFIWRNRDPERESSVDTRMFKLAGTNATFHRGAKVAFG